MGRSRTPDFRRFSASRQRRSPRVGSLVLVAALTLGACGDEPDESGGEINPGEPNADGGFAPEDAPEEEPASGPSTMEGAAPIPDNAVPSGDAETDGGVTTQSYLVDGVTPEQLINDYQVLAESAGWVAEGAPEATGTTDWSLTMTNGSDVLVASTAPAGIAENPSETELSLQVTAGA